MRQRLAALFAAATLLGTPAAAEPAVASHTGPWPLLYDCDYYEHARFGGERASIRDGVARRYVGDDWNDQISSIACSPVCAAIVYEHRDFGGASERFEGFIEFVGSAWNDKISSIRIECGEYEGPPEPLEAGMEDDTDRPGSNLRRVQMSNDGEPAECRAACEAEDMCEAWTYVRRDVQAPQPVCYLKTPAPAPVADDCCISGTVARQVIGPGMEDDTDRPGHDYDNFPVLFDYGRAHSCQSRCQADERCAAWTFVRAGVQGPIARCYLKSAAAAPVPNDCCISGVPFRASAGDLAREPGSFADMMTQLAEPRCRPGFVPRGAGPDDRVCAPPASRDRTRIENGTAHLRVNPAGAYGPNSCVSGYVWREAFDGDVVCVLPEVRAVVREENRLAPERTQ